MCVSGRDNRLRSQAEWWWSTLGHHCQSPSRTGRAFLRKGGEAWLGTQSPNWVTRASRQRGWETGIKAWGLSRVRGSPGQSGSPRNIRRASLRSACLVLVGELKQKQETVPAEQDLLGGSAGNQAEGTKGTQWGTPELQGEEQGLSAKGRWEVSGPRKVSSCPCGGATWNMEPELWQREEAATRVKTCQWDWPTE